MTARDGVTRSLWQDDAIELDTNVPLPAQYPAAEICVVGAGIAGLSVAYLLTVQGRRVTVLDQGLIGSGQTSRSTAHLSSVIDDRFTEIERMHGERGSKLAYESHAAAIDMIESIAAAEQIDCDFARIPGYLMAERGDQRGFLERELGASRRAGLDGRLLAHIEVGGATRGPCIRFENQARFNPMKYLNGLARAVARLGATIYTGTRVSAVRGRDVDERQPARVIVAGGGKPFAADAIVVATNTPGPIKDWLGIYFKQAPYRTYVIGLRVPRGAFEDALYWDTGDPYHYVRLEAAGGDPETDVLIVGGEDHKTGQMADGAAPFDALESWARATFSGCGDVIARWSGQVQEPLDGLGFIGRAPTKGGGVFVITGDSGMGLTHGTLGAQIVADLIVGRPNPWAQLYDPERKPLHSLGAYAQENANTAAQWLDLVTPGQTDDESRISPRSGAIVRSGLTKLAVYRDETGEVHRCSALCPHLKAIVHWNPIERTWDCPAHGSRFDALGSLLVGPATSDLNEA